MKVGKRWARPLYRRILLALTLTLTTGCSLFRPEPLDWSIGVVAPKHYDVWVDYLFLETTGIRAWRVPVGWVSCCWKSPGGKGGSSNGTPPPNYVVIRWFSYAERKFYGRQIRLPDDLEQRMRQKTPYRLGNGSIIERPRYNLILGLAPGGQIVVWIMNQARNAEEIMRVQAFELEGNPEHYHIESYLEQHGEYLEQHGIQYEGW